MQPHSDPHPGADAIAKQVLRDQMSIDFLEDMYGVFGIETPISGDAITTTKTRTK